MLRVGILGAGNLGRIHAAAFARTGKAKISAVYAPEQSSSHLADLHGARCARTLDEFFGDMHLDVVVIATPTHTHAELLEKAHETGVHVLCEKPLVRTEAELRRIEALFAGYPKMLMVGHTVRFFPEYEYARKVLIERQLGQLGVLRLGRCAGFDLPSNHWLFDFEKSGGAVLDMMIHDLDFAEWAAGPIVNVFARRSLGSSLADDLCLVVGRLADGALIHVEASWAEPPNTFYYFYELAASHGILDFDSRRAPAYSYKRRGAAHCCREEEVSFSPTRRTPYDRQAEAFIAAVAHGTPSPVPLTEGARAVRLALAVLDSAALKRPVDVSPTGGAAKQ
ncbi:MAG: Gfo/Idh/MocA family protein [Candidatus Sumerlaeaceae bacterium]